MSITGTLIGLLIFVAWFIATYRKYGATTRTREERFRLTRFWRDRDNRKARRKAENKRRKRSNCKFTKKRKKRKKRR